MRPETVHEILRGPAVALPAHDLPRVVHVLDAEREEEPDVDVPKEGGLDSGRYPVKVLGDRDDV
ncbi:MAG: hypothetical protein WB984_05360 [Thermoplasmata archaeon]